jgi:hypothetical protein
MACLANLVAMAGVLSLSSNPGVAGCTTHTNNPDKMLCSGDVDGTDWNARTGNGTITFTTNVELNGRSTGLGVMVPTRSAAVAAMSVLGKEAPLSR